MQTLENLNDKIQKRSLKTRRGRSLSQKWPWLKVWWKTFHLSGKSLDDTIVKTGFKGTKFCNSVGTKSLMLQSLCCLPLNVFLSNLICCLPDSDPRMSLHLRTSPSPNFCARRLCSRLRLGLPCWLTGLLERRRWPRQQDNPHTWQGVVFRSVWSLWVHMCHVRDSLQHKQSDCLTEAVRSRESRVTQRPDVPRRSKVYGYLICKREREHVCVWDNVCVWQCVCIRVCITCVDDMFVY